MNYPSVLTNGRLDQLFLYMKRAGVYGVSWNANIGQYARVSGTLVWWQLHLYEQRWGMVEMCMLLLPVLSLMCFFHSQTAIGIMPFLPAQRYAIAVLDVIVCPSVHLSVHPYVSRR